MQEAKHEPGREDQRGPKRGLSYDQEQWGRNEDLDQGNGPTIRGKWHWSKGEPYVH